MKGTSAALSGVFAGRYTIEREVGRGATAVVYLARDESQNRAVAIKILRAELVTEISTERFLREIRVTTRLQHPNIVPVLDSGAYDDRLFFVLPFMEGGTLRARLEREKQLPIGDVITIGTTIAAALQSAHEQKLLHRDVKPENILFAAGHPCLADFGIARALSESSDSSNASSTSTGVVRGTPAYMSPEQAAGDRDIDARSDVYSLACVLYEALAGIAAFVGPTPQSVLSQRLAHVPRGVRVYRPTAPVELERVLEKALALAPADRYQTAGEFGAAIENAVTPGFTEAPAQDAPESSRRVATLVRRAAIVVLAGGTAWAATRALATGANGGPIVDGLERLGIIEAKLDTTAYAVLSPDSSAATFDIAEPLRNRLRRWNDVTLIEPSTVGDAEHDVHTESRDERARAVARRVRAGRYLRARAVRTGDSLDIAVALFDTRSGVRLAERSARVATDAAAAHNGIESLADGLLLRDDLPHASRAEGSAGTVSLRARRTFLRGQVALESGDFARADSLFFAATRFDAEYAQALVWLADVRSWMDKWKEHPWSQVAKQAAQAVAQRGRLAPADSVLLSALVALDGQRWQEACRSWEQLTRLDAYDFAAWYGYANCLRRDPGVVEDLASPSGWRFRTSYEQAVRAYEQAFRLRPAILRAFGGSLLPDLQFILFTNSSQMRAGRAAARDSLEFRAFPTWRGDSIAFIPIPKDAAPRTRVPDEMVTAIQRQRERFHVIAQMWRAEVPVSAEAAEAVAVALEILGNPAALDTMRLARSLATSAVDRFRIAADEVLLQVKFSLPSDLTGLARARSLADSLIAQHPSTDGRYLQLLGSLAGLTGRANLAAYLAAKGGMSGSVPPSIAQSGPALLTFSALGGPDDSLQVLEENVEAGIRGLPRRERDALTLSWLARAAVLAFPNRRSHLLTAWSQSRGAQVDLLAAAVASDSDAVRRRLDAVADVRLHTRPADIAIDGLFPEAAALSFIGDTRRAIQWLDPTLRTIRFSPTRNLANVFQTGALVRAMVLRAQLADRVGDRAAARAWANAVVVLWSNADPFLQSVVRDMKQLTR